MTRERRALIAGALSFVVPGLGLAYLGRVRSAWANFLIATGVLSTVIGLASDASIVEHIHYLILAIAALSSGYAHGVARTTKTLSHSKAGQASKPKPRRLTTG